jgi:lipopolysaccharide export system protein LptC
MAWTSRDNFHSRLVFWLKILLPLTALGILSTLFMVSRGVDPEDAIPYADVDIADRVREPRLTDAVFAGMTADGAALTIKAGEARPGVSGSDNAGFARDLNGLLETPDGARTDLTARTAQLDQVARLMVLSGGVVLTNSAGYRVETPGVRISLDQTGIDSDGAITAMGPVGQITAASMHLGPAQAEGPGYLLVFKGDVRLLYQPAQ